MPRAEELASSGLKRFLVRCMTASSLLVHVLPLLPDLGRKIFIDEDAPPAHRQTLGDLERLLMRLLGLGRIGESGGVVAAVGFGGNPVNGVDRGQSIGDIALQLQTSDVDSNEVFVRQRTKSVEPTVGTSDGNSSPSSFSMYSMNSLVKNELLRKSEYAMASLILILQPVASAAASKHLMTRSRRASLSAAKSPGSMNAKIQARKGVPRRGARMPNESLA